MAYEGSQAKGRIGDVASGLHHSHSNARSEPHLRPTPQLRWIPNTLSEARDQTQVLRMLVGLVTAEPHRGLLHQYFDGSIVDLQY